MPIEGRSSEIEGLSSKMVALEETERLIIHGKMRRKEVAKKTDTCIAVAAALEVTTAEEYLSAVEYLKAIKSIQVEVDTEFGPVVHSAHQNHKRAVALRKGYDAPLAEADRVVREKIAVWYEAAEERQRTSVARDRAYVRDNTEAAREAQVAELRAEGSVAEADALACAPLPVPTVTAPPVAPPVEGVKRTRTWKARVVDREVFLQACASTPRWHGLVQPDQRALDKLARALQENLDVPGVEARAVSGLTISHKGTNGDG